MGSKNQKLNLDRDILYDLYINKQMTSKEVGEYFGCSSKTIRNYLKSYDIPNNDMTTWIKRDPIKLKTAIKNKIKLLLIYPNHDAYLVKDGKLNNIGKINPIDINDIN